MECRQGYETPVACPFYEAAELHVVLQSIVIELERRKELQLTLLDNGPGQNFASEVPN